MGSIASRGRKLLEFDGDSIDCCWQCRVVPSCEYYWSSVKGLSVGLGDSTWCCSILLLVYGTWPEAIGLVGSATLTKGPPV